MADFSSAEENPMGVGDFAIRTHPQEVAAGKLLNRRCRVGMTQHAFRSKHHQRFPPRTKRLPPEEMKILGGTRRLANLEIVEGRELQETLDAGAGMLRALTFVAVRQ